MHQKYPRVQAMRLYATPPGKDSPIVVACTDEGDLHLPATHVETTVLEKDDIFFGRLKPGVVVTLPLHDRNGETIAALRVEMKSFVGQTENNAVARATPIAKDMESRLAEAKDLF
jgi:hypothetical protein